LASGQLAGEDGRGASSKRGASGLVQISSSRAARGTQAARKRSGPPAERVELAIESSQAAAVTDRVEGR
jgi:hypothetical protein